MWEAAITYLRMAWDGTCWRRVELESELDVKRGAIQRMMSFMKDHGIDVEYIDKERCLQLNVVDMDWESVLGPLRLLLHPDDVLWLRAIVQAPASAARLERECQKQCIAGLKARLL